MNDPWHTLRRFTQARIAQGRSGSSLPTDALLDFQLAHASARDAIHQKWDFSQFVLDIHRMGLKPLCLNTQVSNRMEYLQRPDKGRSLDQASRELLQTASGSTVDAVITISNGLSSTAMEKHGLAFLQVLAERFNLSPLSLGPICLIPNARVAVSDEIGSLLNARLSIILIGERPGLSAADSIGCYLTYAPKIGNTDAERNCLSNIREPEGLSYHAAATKLLYLGTEAIRRRISGVTLKDDKPMALLG